MATASDPSGPDIRRKPVAPLITAWCVLCDAIFRLTMRNDSRRKSSYHAHLQRAHAGLSDRERTLTVDAIYAGERRP